MSPQGWPKRGMKINAPLCNESVRTRGGHPKEANHRRGGPHRGPTQNTLRQYAQHTSHHTTEHTNETHDRTT